MESQLPGPMGNHWTAAVQPTQSRSGTPIDVPLKLHAVELTGDYHVQTVVVVMVMVIVGACANISSKDYDDDDS